MYTTYHFKSASEVNIDILHSIKNTFKDKPIVITIEEEMDETAFLMSEPANKLMLQKSIAEYKNGETISIEIPDSL